MNKNIEVVQEIRDAIVQHTIETGKEPNCLFIGREQAETIVDYLILQSGIVWTLNPKDENKRAIFEGLKIFKVDSKDFVFVTRKEF